MIEITNHAAGSEISIEILSDNITEIFLITSLQH